MALAPHWLDDVVGPNKTAETVIQALACDSSFKSLVEKAVQRGLEAEEAHKKDPRIIGADYKQTVRAAIQRGIAQNKLDLNEL